MKYDFRCKRCEHLWEVDLSFLEFEEAKEEGLSCPSCEEGKGANVLNPGNLEVSLKGFAWANKNYKEKEYRKRRSKYMAQRQKEVRQTPRLAPNYKGERTATWKEARDAARGDGKIHETYDHLVAEEESLK